MRAIIFGLLAIALVSATPAYAQITASQAASPDTLADTINALAAAVKSLQAGGDGHYTQVAFGKAAVEFAKAQALAEVGGNRNSVLFQMFQENAAHPSTAARKAIAQSFVGAIVSGAMAGLYARASADSLRAETRAALEALRAEILARVDEKLTEMATKADVADVAHKTAAALAGNKREKNAALDWLKNH